jgi:chromosome segregation ATPase
LGVRQIIESLENEVADQKPYIETLEKERDDLYNERDDLADQLDQAHRDRSLLRSGTEEQVEEVHSIRHLLPSPSLSFADDLGLSSP